ncbi:MAG: hypothetical protein WC554_12950 [Clostridia bacterium]
MSLYDEFDKNLYKIGQNVTVQESDQLQGGSIVNSLVVSSGSLRSGSFDDGISGWQISDNGDAQFNNLTLTGGVLKSGKTSFTDSTNAGYYISNAGVYVGSALDATKLKYTVADGTLDLVGTISSRSTATIAGAIDSVGDLITTKLNTSTKRILSDFNFGTTDYAGAVKAGDIAWNTSTGAITSGSGVVVYRNGIVGASSGTPTFSIDATTGNATFAGTLSGASGTFGTITAGTIDGCDVYANNFRFKRNTHILTLSNLDDGWATSLSPSLSVTKYASNQLKLYLASTSNETSSIKAIALNAVIGGSTTTWLPIYSPSIEFATAIDVGTSDKPSCKIRLGDVSDDTGSFVGFWFVPLNTSGYVTVNTQGKNTGAGGTSFGDNTINGYDASKWHKYRITITKNTSTNFTARYYIDDTLVQTSVMDEGWAGGSYMFGLTMTNNSTTVTDTIDVKLSQVILQQSYS